MIATHTTSGAPNGLKPQDICLLVAQLVIQSVYYSTEGQYQIHTIGHFVAQTDVPLLSHGFFFSSNAHIPPWTASNSTGFKSPYSPDATSMTEPEEKARWHADNEGIRNVPDYPQQSVANT